MKTSAETLPSDAVDAAGGDASPLWAILLIFWTTFAAAVTVSGVVNPTLFVRHDPDSMMRLVAVRDLLAGQGWFDLVQHRMHPPGGVLMHWSRLIDAPLAALVAIGNFFGIGEAFALTAWPLLLLLAFMAGVMLTATALGGRPAAVPTLILSLLFLDPLLSYLPNDIDHHSAQYALMAATLAATLRLRTSPFMGLAAGLLSALMLAIGVEMLPYVGVLGSIIALQWAVDAERGRGTALFGMAFAITTPALFLLTASPEAQFACDSLSLAYALPAALAGFGLAALVFLFGQAQGRAARIAALALVAAIAGGSVMLVQPDCLGGPYGFLSAELKALWLETVLEAQSLPEYALRQPVGAIATLGPPIVALVLALRRARIRSGGSALWIVAAALLASAIALSFYQVRTIPFANTVAIPVLGAWLAEVAARYRVTAPRPLRRALPLVGVFLIAMPLAHLAVGWAAVEAISLASGGRIAPPQRVDAPEQSVAGLSAAEKDCLDPASAALLRAVPDGIVLAPVFYGSAVLALSGHSVVAGPYHRGGAAIIDAIHAMRRPPPEAHAIVNARDVDYVAVCSTSREAALVTRKAPDGLLAMLLSGGRPDWLEPVDIADATTLRLWRVVD